MSGTDRDRVGSWFPFALAGLVGFYLTVEASYVLRLPLVMDEFQGAAAVYRLFHELPYRDFSPYKTVLGYYLQLPALALCFATGGGLWDGLMWVKLEMALAVAAVIGWAAWTLRRAYRPQAIVAALALLFAMSTFLERSAELRVDMPTGLAGLISLVLLVRRRPGWAGVWAAVSILVSQKGAMYAAAGLVGLAVGSRFRPDGRGLGASIARFAAGLAGVLTAYAVVWGIVGLETLMGSAAAPVRLVLADVYDIRLLFWIQTLVRNPLFYLGALVAIVRPLFGRPGGDPGGWSLSAYGAVITAAGLWYDQPWPYFFVLLVPTYWVLLVVLIDELLPALPTTPWARAVTVVGVALWGVAYPLAGRLPAALRRDSAVQREVVELAEVALRDGGTYVAGVDLLYDRRQAESDLGWLDAAALARLAAMDATEASRLRERLAADPPVVLIENYRIDDLPPVIRASLDSLFLHRHLAVAVFAPRIGPLERIVSLPRAGDYRPVEEDGGAAGSCTIGGREVGMGTSVRLEAGRTTVRCATPARLLLVVPEIEDVASAQPTERRPLFPSPYTY